MASNKRLVSVKILDQTFTFHTDAPLESVQKIADFLSNNLKEIQNKSKGISPYNAAILAALNISEKYFSAAEKQAEFKSKVLEKSKRILCITFFKAIYHGVPFILQRIFNIVSV